MWVFFWEEHECHFTVFQTVMCSKISNNSLKDRPLKSWSLLSRTITFEKPLFLRDHYFWGIMTFQGLSYYRRTIMFEKPLLLRDHYCFEEPWILKDYLEEPLLWEILTFEGPLYLALLYVQLFIRKMRKREVTFKR